MNLSIRMETLVAGLIAVGGLIFASTIDIALTGFEFATTDILLFTVLFVGGIVGSLTASQPNMVGTAIGVAYFSGFQLTYYIFSTVGIIQLRTVSEGALFLGICISLACVFTAKQLNEWRLAVEQVSRVEPASL